MNLFFGFLALAAIVIVLVRLARSHARRERAILTTLGDVVRERQVEEKRSELR